MDSNEDFLYLNSLENLEPKTENFKCIVKKIIDDVKTGRLAICDLLKKLEILLASSSHSKREIGVLILNAAIEANGNNFNDTEITFLSIFYTDKLKEHHDVAVAALPGTFLLLKSPLINSDIINKLISSIFKNIVCQQQQREDRYLIYQIFHFAYNSYLKEVNNIDNTYGLISSIDGERDPQNLMYLFKWLMNFLPNAKLDHLTELMFDILSCYFPIDFTTSAKENKNITRDALAQYLCSCLTAIPQFGQFAIPLALEKLDSEVEVAKMDSLDILIVGCTHYSAETYHEHFNQIWNQLQKEIFIAKNEQIEIKCLLTIKEIVKKLATLSDSEKFNEAVHLVMLPIKENLIPDSKFHTPTTKILLAVAEASESSSQIVMKSIGTFLIKLFNDKCSDQARASVIDDYLSFLNKFLLNNKNLNQDNLTIQKSIELFEVAAFNQDETKDVMLLIAGFKGLTVLCQFLQENLRGKFLQKLKQLILQPQENQEFKSVLVNCLKQMAIYFPVQIEKEFLTTEINDNIGKFDFYFSCIGPLFNLPQFENLLAEFVTNYAVKSIDYSNVIFKHLPTFWNKNFQKILYRKNFVQKIITFLSTVNENQIIYNSYLTNIRLALQTVIDQSEDQEFRKTIYSLITEHTKFNSQLIYVTVLSSSIVIMRQKEFEDYEKMDFLLNCYFNTVTTSAAMDEFLQNIILEIIANILNKITDEYALEKILNKIGDLNSSCPDIRKVIVLIIWITKSLFMRDHCKSQFWGNQLISWLRKSTAAESLPKLTILMKDNSILSIENYCKMTVLYKQKCFIYLTNELTKEQLKVPETNYNLISYLMEYAPKQAVIGQFKKIFKMILICLEKSTDSNAVLIILEKLNEYIVEKEAVIEDNFEDLLLRIINLCKFENSMKVRIASIKWLRNSIEVFPIYKLLPHQEQVIHQLGLCLDDRKRLVRKEAMNCRGLWYLLDSPV